MGQMCHRGIHRAVEMPVDRPMFICAIEFLNPSFAAVRWHHFTVVCVQTNPQHIVLSHKI
jgi:hypothetical protein